MRRADRQRWATARSLTDLGQLTSAWLAGEIGQTPGHCGSPDAETRPYLRILAAVNRAGFVTTNMQAAGPSWCAWVEGFARAGTLARLERATAGTRLTVEPLGSGAAREVIGWYRRYCHPGAVLQLRAARFVSVTDPVPGASDVLWPALAAMTGAPTPGGALCDRRPPRT